MGPFLLLTGAAVVLVVANVLSCSAHGRVGGPSDWRPHRDRWVTAPTVVAAARAVTWIAFGVVVLLCGSVASP